MKNVCPVCGYPYLDEPAYNTDGGGSDDICPSCWYQFGYDDDAMHITHKQWREKWIMEGMPWRAKGIEQPPNWDPKKQLENVDVFL